MKNVIKNATVYENGKFISEDFPLTVDGIIPAFNNLFVLPAFCDVHVHLREPGFSYKETIKSGTSASARGGYTDVCSMPNLNPVPDNKENLNIQLDLIKKNAVINVHPYASISIGQRGEELSDFENLCDAVAFSDDGKGIQSEELMLKAMTKAKKLNKIIVAHCEDNSLLKGGYIHKGNYAEIHGHRGICSESEWKPIERDIKLAAKTGCKYHVCHISCKESVELIRKAKRNGVDITCETAPHYLVLTDNDLQEDGKFKMNPPLRSEEDRIALIEGLKDGTIDMIATDHAPHSAKEKSAGLEKSAFGIVGIETAFPIMFTYLVKPGIISLEKLIELMAINPRRRFSLNTSGYTVWDLDKKFTVNPQEFLSLGKATPFENRVLYGECKMTVLENKIKYIKE